jgi:hypothetical protein
MRWQSFFQGVRRVIERGTWGSGLGLYEIRYARLPVYETIQGLRYEIPRAGQKPI